MVQQTLPTYPASTEAYSWRPLTRQDGLALHTMLLAAQAVDQPGWIDTLEDRENDFNDPGSNIATDSMAAVLPSGEFAAVAWVFAPPDNGVENIAVYFFNVHPDHRGQGLEDEAVRWMEARAAQILRDRQNGLPNHLRVWVYDRLTQRAELFARHGYAPVRHNYTMRRDLSLPIPEASLPAGVRLENWTRERDEDMRLACNEAFQDHWGALPTSREAWDLWLTGHPNFRADLTFLAIAEDDPDGNPVAGLAITMVSEAENEHFGIREGWIQDLAVRRSYRQQGLGTALLCHMLQAFKAAGLETAGLGVDTENLTGALRIYQRLGFEVLRSFTTYSKTV